MGNISIYKQDQLDIPTKSFEVAFRSYIAHHILKGYPTKEQLHAEFTNQVSILDQSKAILTEKIKSTLKEYLKTNKKWSDFWDNLQFMDACNQAQAHTDSHDVFYLSLSVTLTFAFKEIFLDLIKAFPDVSNYIQKANSYCEVRNALSHRGSRQIPEELAKDAVVFMQTLSRAIDEKFFWYKSWNNIDNDIQKFLRTCEPLIADNIDENLPQTGNTIVCRETELNDLFKSVCSWDGVRKLRSYMHLTCIAGYGGIGKTALVTEFIKRLQSNMEDDNYGGLKPSFILFYSAKEEKLSIKGDSIVTRKVHKQFSDFDELKQRIYKDLSIESFSDDWSLPGILVIDNLETLDEQNRSDVVDFIIGDIPQCVRVIITTRIPEADGECKSIKLKGFQSADGVRFVHEYVEKNGMNINLKESEIEYIVEHSFGNPLVLVLALKRLSAGVRYTKIEKELKVLPTNASSSVGAFMYQNTIYEIFSKYPKNQDAMQRVLQAMSIYDYPLNDDVLAQALSMHVDLVGEILDILLRYLVIEHMDNGYVVNNFANQFILIGMPMDEIAKNAIKNNVILAVRECEEEKKTLEQYLREYPSLKDVIDDWRVCSEKDGYVIGRAFKVYDEYIKKDRPRKRADALMQIQEFTFTFDRLLKNYRAHPYIYSQRARMILAFRIDECIKDEYNDQMHSDFIRCLKLIEEDEFRSIKKTHTYPSILWKYVQFLWSIKELSKAASYAAESVIIFRNIQKKTNNYYDILALQGMIEIALYEEDKLQRERLRTARSNYQEIRQCHLAKKIIEPKNTFERHVKQLEEKLAQYEFVRID